MTKNLVYINNHAHPSGELDRLPFRGKNFGQTISHKELHKQPQTPSQLEAYEAVQC